MRMIRYTAMITVLFLFSASQLQGLHNHTGAHDPTAIQRSGDTYWIFTTGNGIYSMYSRDLVNWTAGRTPFTKDYYPSWINSYVPGFEGHFWAPECVYMNGKYHLYYSCSTWGSKQSCIGLVTNKTLNPADPEYLWQDQGVVVHSNSGSSANCIDPSVFQDRDGDYFISYGSYFGGIRIVELDSITGKTAGSYHHPVASGDCEASYVIPREDQYFLFINRGSCCRGASSTYHIQVGRSDSPTGPFLDKQGMDLNVGGGSTILSTNGSFIGPGHVGYFVENGEEWVSYHYYDGDRDGAPTLAIGTMYWDDQGWPRISNDFLEEGAYVLRNHLSQLYMQREATAEDGSAVTQGMFAGGEEQVWQLSPVGNGYYMIKGTDTDLLVEPEGCSSSSATLLKMGLDQYMPCEHWKFERTNRLEYVISSRAGNNVIDLSQPVYDEGTTLRTSIFSGLASQYWQLGDPQTVGLGIRVSGSAGNELTLFPNPSNSGLFNLQLKDPRAEMLDIEIFSLDGRCVYREHRSCERLMQVDHALGKGIYRLQVIMQDQRISKTLIIQ